MILEASDIIFVIIDICAQNITVIRETEDPECYEDTVYQYEGESYAEHSARLIAELREAVGDERIIFVDIVLTTD
jgi:L-alanine-DL-glutamate epimerase-like enolase superfamily enzyme